MAPLLRRAQAAPETTTPVHPGSAEHWTQRVHANAGITPLGSELLDVPRRHRVCLLPDELGALAGVVFPMSALARGFRGKSLDALCQAQAGPDPKQDTDS